MNKFEKAAEHLKSKIEEISNIDSIMWIIYLPFKIIVSSAESVGGGCLACGVGIPGAVAGDRAAPGMQNYGKDFSV